MGNILTFDANIFCLRDSMLQYDICAVSTKNAKRPKKKPHVVFTETHQKQFLKSMIDDRNSLLVSHHWTDSFLKGIVQRILSGVDNMLK